MATRQATTHNVYAAFGRGYNTKPRADSMKQSYRRAARGVLSVLAASHQASPEELSRRLQVDETELRDHLLRLERIGAITFDEKRVQQGRRFRTMLKLLT